MTHPGAVGRRPARPEGNLVEFPRGDVLADVLNGREHDRLAVRVLVAHGLAAGIDAGAIVGGGDGFSPTQQVLRLFGSRRLLPPDPGRESLRWEILRGWRRRRRHPRPAGERGGGLALLLRPEDLRVQAAVEDDEEAEAVADQDVALAGPGVVSGSGGLLSQYPVKANCWRRVGSFASPG